MNFCKKIISLLSRKKNIKSRDSSLAINNFNSLYTLEDEISHGSYGVVYKCRKNTNENYYAVKIIKSIDGNEVSLMKELRHESIIQLYEFFVDVKRKRTHIIMELCKHDLFDEIMNSGGKIRNEQKIKIITKQILEGVQYLHSKDIVHRDIKLSNILFDDNRRVKLIDFGMSVKCTKGEFLEEFIGTSSFVSPEIIMGSYNEKCDMWSIGCIVFIMFFGFNPFNSSSRNCKETIDRNILKGFRNETCHGYGAFFPSSIKTSEQAKNFISSLLTDAVTRLSAREALDHPWLQSIN